MKWTSQVADVQGRKKIHGEEEGQGGMHQTLIITDNEQIKLFVGYLMASFAQNRIWKKKTPFSFSLKQHEC